MDRHKRGIPLATIWICLPPLVEGVRRLSEPLGGKSHGSESFVFGSFELKLGNEVDWGERKDLT